MSRKWSYLVVILVTSIAVTAFAASHGKPKDEHFLGYRQKLMSAIGGHMGAIGRVAKTGLPFQDAIAVHAKSIEMSAGLIEKAFEKKITEGKTDAKPDVWKDWDKFVDAAKKMKEEAGKLASVAADDKDAMVAQVKALGKACGGCHKPFRKPKEERFKR